MRILHTTLTYSPSLDGVAEVVRNVSERLARRGHEVHVATSAIGAEKDAELRGVYAHHFDVRGNLVVGIKGEVGRYHKFVRTGNWDLVVNHCLRVWPTDALLSKMGSYPWQSMLVTHGIVAVNGLFDRYYFKISRYLSNYSKWVCVSPESGELSLAQKLNLPKPYFITNGLDMSEWRSRPLGVRKRWEIGSTPWVLNVSNHYGNHHKNHPALFELARHLRETGVRVTHIGNSHRAARWNLGCLGLRGGCFYACRAKAFLSDALEMRTNVPREQVISAIQEADVVVSTSRWEANSLVLLESMAAGVPWVSFDVGSARINAGGVVVRDLDEMKDVVTELLRNGELRRKLGDEGRAQIVAERDWDKIVDRYEHVYERAIGVQADCAELKSVGR